MPQALHRLGVREKRDKGEKGRTAATAEYIMEKNKSDFSWKTLLSVGGAFAPDKSTKQRIIIVVTALVGIFAGSVIPFGTIINVLYPFAGCIGVVLFVIVIVNDFVHWRRGKRLCRRRKRHLIRYRDTLYTP